MKNINYVVVLAANKYVGSPYQFVPKYHYQTYWSLQQAQKYFQFVKKDAFAKQDSLEIMMEHAFQIICAMIKVSPHYFCNIL